MRPVRSGKDKESLQGRAQRERLRAPLANLGSKGWLLFDACSHGGPIALARLLDAGANKEWRDENGWTPIIHAAFIGRLATVKLLADRGADIHARDNDGMNSLMWAGYLGKSAVAAFLSTLETKTALTLCCGRLCLVKSTPASC